MNTKWKKLPIKYLILIALLCLLSCKSLDVDPTTAILKHIITNSDK